MAAKDNPYEGREQTELKHEVLRQYIYGWAFKLGSFASRIWYADCFAGPWQAASENLDDTSIAIALKALNDVRAAYVAKEERSIEVGAIFVEKNAESFKRLRDLTAARQGSVRVETIPGRFEESVDAIAAVLGDDPALLFVDPTGWTGIPIDAIARLVRPKRRDVIINLMTNFIGRFADTTDEALRASFHELFGEELPKNLTRDGIVGFYRERLKQRCSLRFTADVAVPHPQQERTWFHLVVGSHHPKTLELMRDVEANALGVKAAPVRARAKSARATAAGQPSFDGFLGSDGVIDPTYRRLRSEGLAAAPRAVDELLRNGARRFDAIWPGVLETFHIRKSDVADLIREAVAAGTLVVEPGGKLKEATVVRRARSP